MNPPPDPSRNCVGKNNVRRNHSTLCNLVIHFNVFQLHTRLKPKPYLPDTVSLFLQFPMFFLAQTSPAQAHEQVCTILMPINAQWPCARKTYKRKASKTILKLMRYKVNWQFARDQGDWSICTYGSSFMQEQAAYTGKENMQRRIKPGNMFRRNERCHLSECKEMVLESDKANVVRNYAKEPEPFQSMM